MMFAIDGGKTEINPCQIVSAHQDKGGDSWTLYMTDDKRFTVSKHDYALLRPLVCAGTGGGGGLPTLPPSYELTFSGVATPTGVLP